MSLAAITKNQFLLPKEHFWNFACSIDRAYFLEKISIGPIWVNFGPKRFEFVQHDRALLVNKGANGEDCEKKLFGLQM